MHLFLNQTGIALDMDVHICLCVSVCVFVVDRSQEVQFSATKHTVETGTWEKKLLPRTETSPNLHCPFVGIILVVQETSFFM